MTPSTPEQKRRSVYLIILFTFLSATAQVLLKFGTKRLADNLNLMTIVTDVPLIAGLSLYGVAAALMILALQHGELSVLYPLISLSYVWVAIVAVLLFHESVSVAKIVGICVIMAGVAVLGRGAHR